MARYKIKVFNYGRWQQYTFTRKASAMSFKHNAVKMFGRKRVKLLKTK